MRQPHKTHLIPLLAAVLFIFAADDRPASINFFHGSFSEAVKRAKEEKKHIFFDAYADWCSPCKMMEKDVFTDPAVADFFNANFISIRIDMEKGEGPELAKKFPSIDGYPSLLFFSPDGHLNKTLLGSRSAKKLLEEGRLVVEK